MKVEFIPFGDFRPDDLDYESNSLNEAKNVMPIFGSYRLLRSKNNIVTTNESSYVSAAYSHPLLSSEAIQILRPSGVYNNEDQIDITNAFVGWVALPDEDGELADKINESLVDDSNRVSITGRDSLTGTKIIFSLDEGDSPASTAGHELRFRYRLSDVVGATEFTVDIGEKTTTGSPGSLQYNILGVASKTISSFSLTDTTISFNSSGTIDDSGSGFSTELKNKWIKITGDSDNNGSYLVIDATTDQLTISNLFGDAPLTTESAGDSVTIISEDTFGFIQDSISLTPTEASNISDYTNLAVSITPTTLSGDAQFLRPEEDESISTWKTSAGAATNLFDAINEETAADSDYITSGSLSATNSREYKASLSTAEDPKGDDLDHTVRARYKATNSGAGLKVSLVKASGESEEVIEEDTVSSITPGSWIDYSLVIDSANTPNIEDYEDLFLKFTALYPTETSSTVSQFARPAGDVSIGLWERGDGSTTDLWSHINDDASSPDINVINVDKQVGTGNLSTSYIGSLSNISDPKTSSGHTIRGRGKLTNMTAGESLTFQLLEGSKLIKEKVLTWTLLESGDTKSFEETLTATEANSINNYSTLRVKIIASDVDEATYVVDYFELEVPEIVSIQISWAEFEVPTSASLEVSWVEFEIPDADTTNRADQIDIYAGTDTKLYNVSTNSFEDVSKSGGYSSGGDEPHSWDFASWGGAVIATNYIDPVQILDVGDSIFSDMITGTDKPKARFVTPVREFVVLGDISFSGTIDGSPDEVWWSAIDDASDFDVSVTTQCDRQRIRQTPGQITGLVGGEYGIIFKRSSIIRMDYVGYPEIFIFSVLSIRDGTPFSKSIVPVGNDIYFWSSDGLKVLRDGKEIERVGDQARKLLLDSEFSPHAVAIPGRVSAKEEDSFFFGDYDPNSGLIVWAYRGVSDSQGQNTKAIIFDTLTGRLTRLEDSDVKISALASRFNVSTEEASFLRGILGFSWDGSIVSHFKFNSDSTYQAQLTTGIHSFEKDKQISIQRIRPIFRGNPVNTFNPRMEITVTYGPEPLLQTNTTQVTYTKDYSDSHGWYLANLAKSGEFFTIDVVIPSISSQTTKELDGVQIDYAVDGDY